MSKPTVSKPPKLSSGQDALSDSPLLIFVLLVFAVLLMGYTVVTHLNGGIGDEDVHRFQINWFIQGRFEIFKYVTMLPFYHAVVALLGKVSGLTSLNGLRFVHMLFAAGVIPAMYLMVCRVHPEEKFSRTLLLLFTPFLFPLFFLTYTDLPALMLVLLMVERAWKQQYMWAAVLALLAVLIRQPNIIWAAFTVCLIALRTAEELGVVFRLRDDNGSPGLLNRHFLMTALQRCQYFIAVFVLFVVFVLVNGGVAVGDAEQHPISFNLSNLYFFLLVAFVLFLPFCVEQVPAIVRLVRRHWWILVVLVAAFLVYFYTYEHPHKYNRTALAFYRHNLFIHYTSDILPLRIASFVPMAWMCLAFATAVQSSRYWRELLLLIPFSLFSFVPLPLIEQRYYVVTLTLFLVFRPRMSRLSTALSLAIFIGLCAYILFNITRKIFFL